MPTAAPRQEGPSLPCKVVPRVLFLGTATLAPSLRTPAGISVVGVAGEGSCFFERLQLARQQSTPVSPLRPQWAGEPHALEAAPASAV